jgi:mono/diheme cytochrome c family protein
MDLAWAGMLCLALLGACGNESKLDDRRADPGDAAKVAQGAKVYARHCAACHGAKLEGQPNWRQRLPNGRLPAPPHDDSGHTWHHPDEMLAGMIRHGMVPPHAPEGYPSDMPAFAKQLGDEDVWAVIAYIKSHWSRDVYDARAEMGRR